ncbi:UNVERIFIED_CONTAM: hypothetical protein Slati_1404900 [Sesamum latifolium]|uniref:Retrotransposon Copia-like N-terminal domain-containing protein n=1 Tax=Sesamum latifolium TaxID=2727402 RepID=A0AAW2X8I3_9LAMI
MTTDGENRQNVAVAPDFLQLHGGDHPGMVLVSAPFDGIDFLAWKRLVVIALRAKMKLGFIDGRYNVPDSTSGDYETWIRVDSMVTSWILNAMTKKVSKAFLYAKSSRQLWLDLKRDDSYDGIRNQILIMDPFPSINKAYSMVLRVERQRLVNMQNSDNSDGVALHTKWTDNKGGIGQRSKAPDLKNQKRKDEVPARGLNVMTDDGASNAIAFGEAMKQVTEFLKLMKGQPAAETDPLKINFAQGADFAGIGASHSSFINDFGSWIIDTGATNHMCADSSLLTHTHKLINKSLVVHLPDGSSQPVELTGDVCLHDSLILHGVLCVPSFRYNLLSVHKLCTSNSVSVLFSSSHCWLQDKRTKATLVVGPHNLVHYYCYKNKNGAPDAGTRHFLD